MIKRHTTIKILTLNKRYEISLHTTFTDGKSYRAINNAMENQLYIIKVYLKESNGSILSI